jgi:Acetyl xylan esterase (AXE1)
MPKAVPSDYQSRVAQAARLRLTPIPTKRSTTISASIRSARAEVEDTLGHFDGINFADKIACPMVVNIGLQDNVCPTETGYALFNPGNRLRFQSKRDHTTSIRSAMPWNLWRPSRWAAINSSSEAN